MTASRLARPLPPTLAAMAVLGLSAAVALYCIGYSSLNGEPETLASASAWALVNVAPWLAAIELSKRLASWRAVALLLALTALGSIALGTALMGVEPSPFELWRRVPALVAGAAAILVLRRIAERDDGAAASGLIPLPASRIEWVRAAGNYVELAIGGQIILHRSTLSAAERELGEHEFVRIHRSILVRRDRIERFRGADVVLRDGTHLKVGKRYRAAIAV